MKIIITTLYYVTEYIYSISTVVIGVSKLKGPGFDPQCPHYTNFIYLNSLLTEASKKYTIDDDYDEV